MVVEKLRELKEKSHMTNQQIAEKSNVPESTVARIFSGKTPNPTIATAVSMARAMGGSAADFMNEAAPDTDGADGAKGDNDAAAAHCCGGDRIGECARRTASATSDDDASARDMYYEQMISFYKSSIKKKDEWIVRLFWMLTAIVIFILFVLIFDILHPNFGFVKY